MTVAPHGTVQITISAVGRPFTARSDYIYCFEGVEYDWEATEVMTQLQGSIEGWTWRLMS